MDHLSTATAQSLTLSRAVAVLRERTEPEQSVNVEAFCSMMSDMKIDEQQAQLVLERVDFTKGELRSDELLARLELVQVELEHSDENTDGTGHDSEGPSEGEILVANAGFTSAETSFDPWKRTVSQMSMSSMLEPDMSSCRVEVQEGGEMEGPFYDRHRTYSISISSQKGSRVVRRYKDFVWLRHALLQKYPFRTIPAVPPKKLTCTQHLRDDQYHPFLVTASERFLASRRRGLEEFLFLIVNHPVLQKDTLVVHFLSAGDFAEIRGRVHVLRQEDVHSDPDSGHDRGEEVEEVEDEEENPSKDPNWVIYDDAKNWASLMEESLRELQRTLSALSSSQLQTQQQLGSLAGCMNLLLENTQHREVEEKKIPRLIKGLAETHSDLISQLGTHGLRVEVYLRLILGCSDMVTRMKTAKFDGFGKLTNQIVTAQAAAEKLRVRDGTVHTPELDKALAKIISLQRDLLYHCRRNAFIDECLKKELGWVVKMSRPLMHLFGAIQQSLHHHYQTLSDLSPLS